MYAAVFESNILLEQFKYLKDCFRLEIFYEKLDFVMKRCKHYVILISCQPFRFPYQQLAGQNPDVLQHLLASHHATGT